MQMLCVRDARRSSILRDHDAHGCDALPCKTLPHRDCTALEANDASLVRLESAADDALLTLWLKTQELAWLQTGARCHSQSGLHCPPDEIDTLTCTSETPAARTGLQRAPAEWLRCARSRIHTRGNK